MGWAQERGNARGIGHRLNGRRFRQSNACTCPAATSCSQAHHHPAKVAPIVARTDKPGKKKGRSVRQELYDQSLHSLHNIFVTNLRISGALDSAAQELTSHSSAVIDTQYTHLPIDTLAKAVDQIADFQL
jgi:hypothetical protein